MYRINFRIGAIAAFISLAACAHSPQTAATDESGHHARRVILFVWDGMRPDSITEADTPNLAALKHAGAFFSDNHSSYPTFTMMNAAAFATGSFSGKSGFYGNSLWRPGAPARSSSGESVNMNNPVFTEDYGILRQLDRNQDEHLLLVQTLLQTAQKAGLITAAIGKSGPAFMQDYKTGGMVIDEKAVFPLSFAKELQAAKIPLPENAPFAYRNGELKLAADNGDPTFNLPLVHLDDRVTPNPADDHGAPPTKANQYLMSVFLDYILPKKHPDVSVVWLRNPDSTEHPYGVGSPNYHLALKAQDELFGKLQARLAELGMDKDTDLIVVSDHGHSNVSGPLDLFPLRKVENGKMGEVDNARGFSVSGDIRLADELSMAGIHAYDGAGCGYDPVMSGILADGTQLHPDKTDGHCERASTYTTPGYELLHPFLPREAFVVVANGGSDYLYQPEHDPDRILRAVRFLQSHEEFGAIFVDERYGAIPGTLPLSLVRLENAEGRNPDIVVGYTFDEHAVIQGMPGIEFEGVSNFISHGMHGSFSPIDVHNTLIGSGPDFTTNFVDQLPSGNVDVAPTIAHILGLTMPQADGRPLLEAVRGSKDSSCSATPQTIRPEQPATGLTIQSPVGANTGKTTYNFDLQIKELHCRDKTYRYFDWAKAVRN
ncbi:MAG TPA: alkaline phosphatase family protein [Rudaea sp.]|nr:alkaline phosphatase family protein [Rudaea sp.]